MKTLITGGSGQIGHALVETAPQTFCTIAPERSQLNLAQPHKLEQVLNKLAPDAIINSAAYTEVDKAETEPGLARTTNTTSAGIIARYCAKQQIPFFHLSTDYVFSGTQNRPYRPEDTPEANGVYAKTKLAGERLVRDNYSRAVIVRSSWVFGAHGNNFVKTMLRLAETNPELRVVSDQKGSPTCARNLARTIWQLLQLGIEGKLLHYTDAGETTWHNFAETIFAEAVKAQLIFEEPSVSPITTEEYDAPAPRPAYSVLDSSNTLKLPGIHQAKWKNSLRATLLRLAQDQVAESRKAAVA
jgi:dTDP-4-dehydrorhamnose reductase